MRRSLEGLGSMGLSLVNVIFPDRVSSHPPVTSSSPATFTPQIPEIRQQKDRQIFFGTLLRLGAIGRILLACVGKQVDELKW